MKDKPIHFYVANLGSEVQRIFVWKEKGDKEAMQNAYNRALSIIETIKNFGNQNANKEIEILQSCLEGILEGAVNFITRDQISSYFRPTALRITNNL